MRYMNGKKITQGNSLETELSGIFFQTADGVLYIFSRNGVLLATALNENHADSAFDIGPFSLQCGPFGWILSEDQEAPYLIFDRSKAINLSTWKPISPLPENLLHEYTCNAKSEYHYETDSFEFGEYRIAHKGNFGYSCCKNGKRLWDFKGQAYLFTDIVRWENRVFFGTAGHGGYFYVLDLDSGKALLSEKTGGTVYIVQKDNLCYLLSNRRKKAVLLCIDLTNGNILQELDLPGRSTVQSPLQLVGNQLHAITFDYSKGRLNGAFWNCIDL